METKANNFPVIGEGQSDIIKRKDKKSMIKAILIIVGGAIVLFGALKIEDTESVLYLSLLSISVMGMLYGLIQFLFPGKEYVHLPSKNSLQKRTLSCAVHLEQELLTAIREGNTSRLEKFATEQGEGIRVEMLVSPDGSVGFAQLYRWVPYCYEPASDIYPLGVAEKR